MGEHQWALKLLYILLYIELKSSCGRAINFWQCGRMKIKITFIIGKVYYSAQKKFFMFILIWFISFHFILLRIVKNEAKLTHTIFFLRAAYKFNKIMNDSVCPYYFIFILCFPSSLVHYNNVCNKQNGSKCNVLMYFLLWQVHLNPNNKNENYNIYLWAQKNA